MGIFTFYSSVTPCIYQYIHSSIRSFVDLYGHRYVSSAMWSFFEWSSLRRSDAQVGSGGSTRHGGAPLAPRHQDIVCFRVIGGLRASSDFVSGQRVVPVSVHVLEQLEERVSIDFRRCVPQSMLVDIVMWINAGPSAKTGLH